ncbi:MAG: carbon starvation protein A [Armatimonadetes bacterium]|nr:carbon starvation protein A [Armatimonadota bacterium]
MNSLVILIGALCIFALAYRYYAAFLSAKVACLNDQNITPAFKLKDGRDYVPLNKLIVFGHHFAAISGPGPLIGPVLAAQFGYLPGLLWILIGAVLAGGAHDFIILFASIRQNGESLSKIALKEVGKVVGIATSIAILFIIITALAGLGIAVANALSESAWGTFTIFMTIPIAIILGISLKIYPKGIILFSFLGVILLILGVVFGYNIQNNLHYAKYFFFSKDELALLITFYGFLASVLPVWLLLVPRDYLSAYMKIGTILFLALGIFIVHPKIAMPAFTPFIHGGGPVIPGKVWPFVCITIACGAISGFHALIGSGTTPKMIRKESEIPFIGYGAMMVEAFVSIMALIAATSLIPADYFAINVKGDIFAALGMKPVHLNELSNLVGENIQGRPGGAVSLAVGMAYIFGNIPGFKFLMAYWYHFAIMFEAVFILTTLDAGTRVARFLLQDFLTPIYGRFKEHTWLPGVFATSLITCFAWGYLLYFGEIKTIWPMFGIANQLLSTIALGIATTLILKYRDFKYALCTFLPMLFMLATTLSAGFLSIKNTYLPMKNSQGNLNSFLILVMMMLVLIIIGDCSNKWIKLLKVNSKGNKNNWGA